MRGKLKCELSEFNVYRTILFLQKVYGPKMPVTPNGISQQPLKQRHTAESSPKQSKRRSKA